MTFNLTPAAIDWGELDRRLRHSFMAHVAQLHQSLSYTCIRQAYAHTIGKDLHYGIEPANSALIARILPPIVT